MYRRVCYFQAWATFSWILLAFNLVGGPLLILWFLRNNFKTFSTLRQNVGWWSVRAAGRVSLIAACARLSA